MAIYVTDTHALLWYLAGSAALSEKARAALDEAALGTSTVIVPAIVLAEFIMLLEKRHLPLDINDLLHLLQSRPGFQLSSLSSETVLRIQTLTVFPDIHDRLIVAETHRISSALLITRDQMITNSGIVQTVW
jgi:PIN domain nuclease of toxin-antitoxin system